MHKAGFVNIVGNPNVGKSTLMNVLVGERVSIATFKAQTTRHRIMGIYNTDDMQIVFSDTPGMNAAATVLLAFLRPSLLRLFTPRDNPDSFIPSFKTMGISPFLKYTTASVFVHSLALLSIEFFSFTSIWLLLLRVLLCTILTVTCIIAIEGIKK